MGQVDYRCYAITQGGLPNERVAELAAAWALGGAGIIQVRSKPIAARDLYAQALLVASAVREANPETRVVIDDRVDVALALMEAGAHVHGVHLGQDDLPVPVARKLLGQDAIIGLTTGTAELVSAANEFVADLDYIGAGPFKPTPTKDSGREPLGISGYHELVAISKLPIVAIGSVTLDDVRELAATGIAGVAMVRELSETADPKGRCASVLAEFDAGVGERDDDA